MVFHRKVLNSRNDAKGATTASYVKNGLNLLTYSNSCKKKQIRAFPNMLNLSCTVLVSKPLKKMAGAGLVFKSYTQRDMLDFFSFSDLLKENLSLISV